MVGADHAGTPEPPARATAEKSRPVVRLVGDVRGQDLETKERGGAGREDGGCARFVAVGDELARAGRVVGREKGPRTGAQEPLGLAERLDVGVDPLDALDRFPRQRRQAEPDRHDDLPDHIQRVLQEQVVVLADRPAQEVLDGHDADRRIASFDRLEHAPEAAHAGTIDIAKRRQDSVLCEGAGLARVGDGGHATRAYAIVACAMLRA